MVYDEANKKWQPSGSGPGLAKVQLFQHVVNNTYRVVGRKHVDHEVVINCQITKDLRYNQANETFLQWRNAKQVYGLNFQSSTECESFAQVLKLAVDNLCKGLCSWFVCVCVCGFKSTLVEQFLLL
jgi:enabled protein